MPDAARPRETRAVAFEITASTLSFRQLCRHSGVHGRTARRMIELGLIEHVAEGDPREGPWLPEAAAQLARADRLRRDLALNMQGAVLAAELLVRIERLERRLGRYESP